jgi:hypothetical protein
MPRSGPQERELVVPRPDTAGIVDINSSTLSMSTECGLAQVDLVGGRPGGCSLLDSDHIIEGRQHLTL